MSYLDQNGDQHGQGADRGPAGTFRPLADQEVAGGNRFIAPGTEVNGEFGLFHGVLPPGAGAIPHFHTGFSESFYLLAGQLTLRVRDDERVVGPGDFVYVPPNGLHTFHNEPDADQDVELLMLFCPGAPREGYFRELTAAMQRDQPPTDAEIDEIARRFDQVNVRD